MATAIKAIPTLFGEEARRFRDMADATERRYEASSKVDTQKDERFISMRNILRQAAML